MAQHDFSKSTNYSLSQNTQKAINYLAKVLKISPGLVTNGDEQLLQALCGTILYRHLDKQQRYEVMTIIRTSLNRPTRQLEGLLVARITNVLYINKHWGVWSLTTAELENEIKTNDFYQKSLTYIGVAGGVTIADGLRNIWKSRTLTVKNGRWVLFNLVAWGFAVGIMKEGERLDEEWIRRHALIKPAPVIPKI